MKPQHQRRADYARVLERQEEILGWLFAALAVTGIVVAVW